MRRTDSRTAAVRRRLSVLAATALAATLALTAPATTASGDEGTPDPTQPQVSSAFVPDAAEASEELYDIVTETDIPITMRDGRVLRANVHRPAIKGTTTPAPGEFPVILVQTPYGKSVGNTGLGEMNPYLIKRGYIGVIVDVAGTGGSEGQSMLFGTSEALDGAEMVHWSAELEGSNGNVGLLGGSYLGIDQVFTAAAVGPGSPLKAIFPIATASDPYRDLFVAGGVVNLVSSVGLIGGYFGLRTFTPFAERMNDPADAFRLALEHGLAGIPFELTTAIHALLDTGRVYDSAYWQERAPQNVLDQVVANGVPAYLVGGQYDVFQRGEPLLYSGLQNAWAGKSVWAPMEPGQPVTPRYQLLTGPWDHGNQGSTVDLNAIQLAWFDHWLKGMDTGITDTSTPFHVQEPDGATYSVRNYPAETATYQRIHLHPGQQLAPGAPDVPTGTEKVTYRPIALSCQRALVQWSAGLTRDLYASCQNHNGMTKPQPGDVAYDSGVLTEDLRLAGPVGLTVQATSTTAQSLFVVTLQSVAPDGKVTDISAGALLGTARAIDPDRSWSVNGDGFALPYHPHTEEAEVAVPRREMARYDIEIRPVFETIPAGHRLRLLIQTGDTPHLLTSPMRLLGLLGGVYQVQNNQVHQSWLELPVAAGALPAAQPESPVAADPAQALVGLLQGLLGVLRLPF
ncbi:CocE/NonD family hydrolase [Nocardioides sp. AE5]|uniref:CocE/NonD family hydrolase n=1 Tax=Nocardioides sp. AE5 TaxID=2962573 RepID=UPI002881641E|nr:CocE/NonD family hydrolase [Nocardioides sp. AE5]MDT0200483.1 CocE/NonD family hydrolase [Nocardioides sp. AE5]